jgi:hypothetical protein
MVSLKWGDVLSTLLPGGLALFAIAPFFPLLDAYMNALDKISVPSGVALLIAATLIGGVLEAFTRVTWERYFLCRVHPIPSILEKLNAKNLDLYERGVQSSYKYVTFYANFAWAVAMLFFSRILTGATTARSAGSIILAIVFVLLLFSSYVQWTYFATYLKRVFDREEF